MKPSSKSSRVAESKRHNGLSLGAKLLPLSLELHALRFLGWEELSALRFTSKAVADLVFRFLKEMQTLELTEASRGLLSDVLCHCRRVRIFSSVRLPEVKMLQLVQDNSVSLESFNPVVDQPFTRELLLALFQCRKQTAFLLDLDGAHDEDLLQMSELKELQIVKLFNAAPRAVLPIVAAWSKLQTLVLRILKSDLPLLDLANLRKLRDLTIRDADEKQTVDAATGSTILSSFFRALAALPALEHVFFKLEFSLADFALTLTLPVAREVTLASWFTLNAPNLRSLTIAERAKPRSVDVSQLFFGAAPGVEQLSVQSIGFQWLQEPALIELLYRLQTSLKTLWLSSYLSHAALSKLGCLHGLTSLEVWTENVPTRSTLAMLGGLNELETLDLSVLAAEQPDNHVCLPALDEPAARPSEILLPRLQKLDLRLSHKEDDCEDSAQLFGALTMPTLTRVTARVGPVLARIMDKHPHVRVLQPTGVNSVPDNLQFPHLQALILAHGQREVLALSMPRLGFLQMTLNNDDDLACLRESIVPSVRMIQLLVANGDEPHVLDALHNWPRLSCVVGNLIAPVVTKLAEWQPSVSSICNANFKLEVSLQQLQAEQVI